MQRHSRTLNPASLANYCSALRGLTVSKEIRVNTLLQLTDAITGRRCVVRIDPDEATLPLSSLLDKYLRHCPARRLLAEGRVTVESSETLLSFQDLVYACSDAGELQDIYAGVELVQHGKPLALDEPPASQPGRVGGVDVAVLDIGIDRTDAGYDRNWTGFHRRRLGPARRPVRGVRPGRAPRQTHGVRV